MPVNPRPGWHWHALRMLASFPQDFGDTAWAPISVWHPCSDMAGCGRAGCGATEADLHMPTPSGCSWTWPWLFVVSPGDPPFRGAGVTDVRAGQAPMAHPNTATPAFTLSRDLAGGKGAQCSVYAQGSADLGAELVVAPALLGCPGLDSMGSRHLPSQKHVLGSLPGGQQTGF